MIHKQLLRQAQYWLGLLLIMGLVFSAKLLANDAKQQTFAAVYKVQFEAIDLGYALMTFKQQEDNLFALNISAKTSGWVSLLYSDELHESALLEYNETGQLRTRYYEYQHLKKGKIKEKRSTNIDYNTNRIYNHKQKSWDFQTVAVTDRLSLAFYLGHEKRQNREIPSNINIVDGNQFYTAKVRYLGRKSIDGVMQQRYKLSHEVGKD